jgi:hypothetical protein
MDFSAWFEAYLADIGRPSMRGITDAELAGARSDGGAMLPMAKFGVRVPMEFQGYNFSVWRGRFKSSIITPCAT